MFESRKHYEWDVPGPMREPGVTYWRALSLAWSMPWFVLTIRWHEEDAPRNFLIGNDADLVGALQAVNGRGVLESLAYCMPSQGARQLSWSMHELVEVWMGCPPGEATLIPVCIDRHEQRLCGLALEPRPDFALSHFVARVGETVCVSVPGL